MMIWGVVFILLIILWSKHRSQRMLMFTFVILYLLVAFRHPSIGMEDTERVYLYYFNEMKKQSLSWVYDMHKDKDVLFYLFTWIFQRYSTNYQLYLSICALPFFIATYKYICKYSVDYSVSTVLFISVNFYYMSFTTIRHCIALALVTYAFVCLKQEKLRMGLLYILFASCFHLSAIVSLLLFPIKYLKFRGWYLLLFVPFAYIGYVGKDLILDYMLNLILGNFSRFAVYEVMDSSLNWNYTILIGGLLTFSYYIILNRGKTKQYNYELWAVFLGFVFACFVFVYGEFMRVSSFFIIPLMTIVPRAFRLWPSTRYGNILFLIVFYGYFVISVAKNSNILKYQFFF